MDLLVDESIKQNVILPPPANLYNIVPSYIGLWTMVLLKIARNHFVNSDVYIMHAFKII